MMNKTGPMARAVEILLVEDSRDDEELTLLTLLENNISNNIKVVRDGFEAVEYLWSKGIYAGKREPLPHLILLDIKLPRLNGIEVLERIKRDERLHTIPVVMLTSSREEPDVKRSYELGANSYIVKPVDFDQFRETIKVVGLYWQIVNVSPPDIQYWP